MTERDTAQRPGDKANGKPRKGQEGAELRVIGGREEQRPEHQRRRRALEKKVVPLKGVTQKRTDNQFAH